MNLLDLFILLVVILGFILGFKDGFIRKLIGLIGFALAIYLGISLSPQAGKIIESLIGVEIYLAEITGGLLIVSVVILIFAVIKRFVHPFDKVNNVINQLFGGIVGVIQILFLLSAFLILLNIFSIPDTGARTGSLFYQKTYDVIPLTIDYISAYTPNPEELIKDYIKDKDSIP